MRILVTGGAGYIGSHTCIELLGAGHDLVIVDSLVHGSPATITAIEAVSGRTVAFHVADIRDRRALRAIFAAAPVDAVFHFAALKAVGESVHDPLRYYDHNVGGTAVLARCAVEAGVGLFVFSSSASVYGVPRQTPVAEDVPLAPINPYGRSKATGEALFRDLQAARDDVRVALLRYFNPGGAHPSGRLGEDPGHEPENLLPTVARVAAGALPHVPILGDDWPTPDGTGVRDYVHVVDIARGHVAALEALLHPPAGDAAQPLTVNLGTGRGYSVLEIVAAFEAAVGHPIARERRPRRPGDVAACHAEVARARALLGWQAEFGLERICTDAWRWHRQQAGGVVA